MPDTLPPPLGGPAPAEVPLPRSPLVRVLAQAQLPGILKIALPDEAARFQEELRGDYPLLDREQSSELRIVVGEVPNLQQSSAAVWRFRDLDDAWRISLTPSAVSLEAFAYPSRTEFLGRWSRVLEAVERLYDPKIVERIGIRYLDHVKDEAFDKIASLVRAPMVGLLGDETRPHVVQSVNQALVNAEEGTVLVRWGALGADMVIDPNLMGAHPKPSFILDIDVFAVGRQDFAHQALADAFQGLAQRAYAVFRYAVDDEFLRFYGGEI
jgi:uncharacterized protein (TIGR04255 family)